MKLQLALKLEKRAYSSDGARRKSWHWRYKDKYLLELAAKWETDNKLMMGKNAYI